MKIAKIISGFFCVACAALGGVGFYYNSKTPEEANYTIDYIYYIDGTVVDKMPENVGSYDFDNYFCTNKVTGEWNEAEWKFTPNLTSDTTCELHFKTKTYEVKVEFNGATNVDEEYNGISTVKKGESLEFIVQLNEGYGFDGVVCSNKETATFDVNSGRVVIGPFNNGATCAVNFKINEYKVKAEVTNGNPGSSNVTVEHGKTAELEITPTTNYTIDTIDCTEGMTGTWKDNKLTVENVTTDSTCIVKFKLQSYKVEVKVTNGSVDGLDSNSKTIAYGKSDSFVIKANDGYTLDGGTVDCGKNATGTLTNSKLQVSQVTGATTCTVKLQAKPVEEDEENN